MRSWNGTLSVAVCLAVACLVCGNAIGEERISGERLDPATYGPGIIESMTDAIARDRYLPREYPRDRYAEHGVWTVPSRRATTYPNSGEHNVVNKWGDTRMGIGFPGPVDVIGAYFAGQAGAGAWTSGVRVIGYLDGVEVARTDWFLDIGAKPAWFEMNLRDVNRIEIEAIAAINGAGWYGMDDLTYAVRHDDENLPPTDVVIDFEDAAYGTKLTGTGYAGLTWEEGTGEFLQDDAVHSPMVPPREEGDAAPGGTRSATASGTRSTTPTVLAKFQTVLRGDADSWSYPPDTDGAIGPNHFVVTVNRVFAVYDRADGDELLNISLGAFLPGSNGDPRVLFDQHSGRWIVLVTDFDTRIYVAISLTDDPMGEWFKTDFVAAQGADAGKWVDYPTLGVDANGIYTAGYLVGGASDMTIFAIDKAPLLASPPSLGTVTAFRELAWEGAIQPAHTYGTADGEYFISTRRNTTDKLRIRRVNPPLSDPTLSNLGTVVVPDYTDPPLAPALGSSTDLDTVGARLMMAVYRDGSLWTCHTINVDGRAGCRWYEVAVPELSLVQSGSVGHTSLHFFFPSIMVNQYGSAVMAFTGSKTNQYASCYYTGRLASDPPGEMAAPVVYKAGAGPQNNLDSYGRNRWGDYSYTTLDPTDEIAFWTIQEYGHGMDVWGTYVAHLSLGDGDCNGNGVPDYQDIASGTSVDCNANLLPDECDLVSGASVDCNANTIPDECDIGTGASPDCNANGVPDECDLSTGSSTDCNGNSIPDECDLASGLSRDCNGNGMLDECDFAVGFAYDCNGNGIPDSCDVGTFVSQDCNHNGLPDECEVDTRDGLVGVYYNELNFTGTKRTRLVSTVDFDWGTGAPWYGFDTDTFSVRWSGFVQTGDAAGEYSFYTRTDDGVRLWVAGELLIDQWVDQGVTEHSGTITLNANAEYPVRMEYYENGGDAVAELRWQAPGGAKVIIPAENLIPGRDCNDNGLLDDCDFVTSYQNVSPQLAPVGSGNPQSFTMISPPQAVSDVELTFNAKGDLRYSNEYIDVDLNGMPIGTLYTGIYFACEPNQIDELTVLADDYNAAVAGGNAVITMVPSAAVHPLACSGDNHIQVSVMYEGVTTTLDENGNGIPDECEEQGPALCAGDMNCDGRVDYADIDPFVAALGCVGGAPSCWDPACPWLNADCNGDEAVDYADIDAFVARIGATCP